MWVSVSGIGMHFDRIAIGLLIWRFLADLSVFSSPKQSTDSAPIYPRALARSTR
jgi:hypothetical protein